MPSLKMKRSMDGMTGYADSPESKARADRADRARAENGSGKWIA